LEAPNVSPSGPALGIQLSHKWVEGESTTSKHWEKWFLLGTFSQPDAAKVLARESRGWSSCSPKLDRSVVGAVDWTTV